MALYTQEELAAKIIDEALLTDAEIRDIRGRESWPHFQAKPVIDALLEERKVFVERILELKSTLRVVEQVKELTKGGTSLPTPPEDDASRVDRWGGREDAALFD